MVNIDRVVASNGYLISVDTGDKVVFYECDQKKNTECDKKMCRRYSVEDEGEFGFCTKTTDKRFRKEGGKAWYAVLRDSDDGEPYWGREYVEVD